MIKRSLIGIASLSLLLVCGWVLRHLHQVSGHAYRELYASFDVTSPQISLWFLSKTAWWPLMLVFLTILSAVPLVFFKRRVWWSMAPPSLGLFWITILIYAPMMTLGSVI
ncbi:hypothetical protein [Arenicella chitinivorans]|uniref:hypothetical protein n=1 Tax=Arenicella chitinivorans TaxID=1329800 RepID=UPI0016722088|nr:hypothetical protein [Arenicella chitinivorans]